MKINDQLFVSTVDDENFSPKFDLELLYVVIVGQSMVKPRDFHLYPIVTELMMKIPKSMKTKRFSMKFQYLSIRLTPNDADEPVGVKIYKQETKFIIFTFCLLSFSSYRCSWRFFGNRNW